MQDLVNRLDDFFRAFDLVDVAHGSGAQAALGIEQFIVHRRDEHPRFAALRLDLFDQFQPVAAAQTDVDHHHIRVVFPHQLQRLGGGGGLADDLQVRRLFDQLAQAVADDGMIINKNDSTYLGLP